MKFIISLTLFTFLTGCQSYSVRYPSSQLAHEALTPRYSADQLSLVENEHLLIVTHATSEFDLNHSAREGINKVIAEFKEQGRPIVYLVSDQSVEGYRNWYTAERSPDFELFSEGGEHNLPIKAKEVTIIGGFFGSTDTLNGCHALSVKDAIRMHFEVSEAPLTINIPIKATYFYDEWEYIRQEILKKKSFDPSSIGIEKYPFASLLFLREGNEGAGDDGNEQNFAHYYTGKENKNYRHGAEVNRDTYQFNFYIDEKLIESIPSSGKRIIHFKMTALP